MAGEALKDEERQVTSVFRRETLPLRLMVTNSGIVTGRVENRAGAVFSIDAWFGALNFNVFVNGLQRLDASGHQMLVLWLAAP